MVIGEVLSGLGRELDLKSAEKFCDTTLKNEILWRNRLQLDPCGLFLFFK